MKPLTTERRSYWRKKFGFWDCACMDVKQDPEPCLRCLVEELCEAEQYWREAVKRVAPSQDNAHCVHCDGLWTGGDGLAEWDHETDCPWLLAQEE